MAKWMIVLVVALACLATTAGPATMAEPASAAGPAMAAAAGPQLVESQPANDADVPGGPETVRLVFDRDVTAADVRMTAAADGVEVAVTPPVLDGTAVVVEVPPGLAQGRYRVSYAVQDDDGGQAKGSLVFAATAPRQQTPPEVTLPTVSETTTEPPTLTATTTAVPTTAPTPTAIPTSPTSPTTAPSAGTSGGGSVVWVVAGVLAVGLVVLVGLNVQSRRRTRAEREHVEPDPDHL